MRPTLLAGVPPECTLSQFRFVSEIKFEGVVNCHNCNNLIADEISEHEMHEPDPGLLARFTHLDAMHEYLADSWHSV